MKNARYIQSCDDCGRDQDPARVERLYVLTLEVHEPHLMRDGQTSCLTFRSKHTHTESTRTLCERCIMPEVVRRYAPQPRDTEPPPPPAPPASPVPGASS